jgi:hypothetical protein
MALLGSVVKLLTFLKDGVFGATRTAGMSIAQSTAEKPHFHFKLNYGCSLDINLSALGSDLIFPRVLSVSLKLSEWVKQCMKLEGSILPKEEGSLFSLASQCSPLTTLRHYFCIQGRHFRKQYLPMVVIIYRLLPRLLQYRTLFMLHPLNDTQAARGDRPK